MSNSERDDAHWDEVDRLWRACRHDLGDAIQVFAGIQADKDCVDRLGKNWGRLCDLDLDVASSLQHGLSEVSGMLGRLGDQSSPADHGPQQLSAVAELAKMGREANPDTDAQTLGELVELGEQAIRDDIDKDLEGGL